MAKSVITEIIDIYVEEDIFKEAMCLTVISKKYLVIASEKMQHQLKPYCFHFIRPYVPQKKNII